MKQTTIITRSMFVDEFQALRPDNFTHDGLVALFDYLEDLEADIGDDIELDVIALCGDYSEYASLAEFIPTAGLMSASAGAVRRKSTGSRGIGQII